MSAPEKFRPGPATVVTAVVIVAVYAVELLLSRGQLSGALAPPVGVLVAMGGITRGLVLDLHQWWRLVAGPLMHADLIHLVLNGVVLVFAGFIVESLVGAWRWLVVYGVGATVGGLFSARFNPDNLVSIGASGAGMALLAAVFVLAFAEQEQSARHALQLNAARFLVPSLLPMATTRTGESIDFAAHFGGAIGGALVALLLLPELKRRAAPEPENPDAELAPPARSFAYTAVGLGFIAFTLAGVAVSARETPAGLVASEVAPREAVAALLEPTCDLGSSLACLYVVQPKLEADPTDATARQQMQALCDRGEAVACFDLARALHAAREFPEAAVAWARVCDGGDTAGCYNQGLALIGAEQADAEPLIRERLGRACPSVPRACDVLVGRLADSDPQQALTVADRGCDADSGESCWMAGTLRRAKDEAERDDARAYALFEKACRLGNFDGCNSQAHARENGIGVQANPDEASALYSACCDKGGQLCCANFGVMLENGIGVEVDVDEARRLYRQSCQAGEDWGCSFLFNLQPDEALAAERAVFEAGCAGGAGKGCTAVGVIDAEAKDMPAAARRFEQGCELDDARACRWLSGLLRRGEGVERDDERAAALLRKACEGGDEKACGD